MRGKQISEIAHTLEVACHSPHCIEGFQVDSRLISQGDLFFALPGAKTDGHHHLGEAKSRGAIAAVVATSYTGPDFDLHLLRVPDVLAALHHLARTAVEASPATLIGVTGSVGKTTTKEFIATLLSAKYRVGKNPASYNTRLTLPTTILNMQGDEEVWVLEMGMEEPGDIGKLVAIAPPHIALLTKVALAHAAYFPGGLAEIARGKAEIFQSPRLRTAVLPLVLSDLTSASKLTFSTEEREADYFLHEGTIDERGVRGAHFELPFKESHLQYNFLAALSVARAMHLSWEEIAQQIPKLTLPKMRFERFERGGIVFINDAYNANPESMKAALSNLPTPQMGGKRIAVLGGMYPLGSFSVEAHRDVAAFALQYVDYLLVYGDEARPLYEMFAAGKKPAEHFATHQAVAERLKELAAEGDVILVKGSRIMRMENVLESYAALSS